MINYIDMKLTEPCACCYCPFGKVIEESEDGKTAKVECMAPRNFYSERYIGTVEKDKDNRLYEKCAEAKNYCIIKNDPLNDFYYYKFRTTATNDFVSAMRQVELAKADTEHSEEERKRHIEIFQNKADKLLKLLSLMDECYPKEYRLCEAIRKGEAIYRDNTIYTADGLKYLLG